MRLEDFEKSKSELNEKYRKNLYNGESTLEREWLLKVNDFENGLIQVTAGGNDYLLFTNSTSIYAYRNEREIAVESSTLDIRDGDKVVMRTEEDYVLGEIIIFRD